MTKKARSVLKVILLGDPSVGKTSLIQQYIHGRFKHSYQVTIGLDVLSKTIIFPDREVELSINDVGGQDRFATMRQLFYTGSHLAMLVYDVTRPKTLDNLVTVWNKELQQYCPNDSSAAPVIKILIGNKADLTDLRTITEEEGNVVATKIGCVGHIVASAKENQNVEKAFFDLTKNYIDKVEP